MTTSDLPDPRDAATVSESAVSENAVSGNAVSGNAVLQRAVSQGDAFDDAALAAALADAQRLGFLGARPVGEAIEHARSVVRALEAVSGRVVDLGAGGGLPGMVIVQSRPDLHVTMVDRRTKRTDFLQRMVRRHGLADRVRVIGDDVERLIDVVESGAEEPFDAAVARGFGPPERTLTFMAGLARPGGLMVITEPPEGDRWDPSLLADVGVERVSGPDGVAVFQRPD